MDFLFSINSPNKVIDIDATNEAIASFEAIGSIASGNIRFQVSTDGVNFFPTTYYSFVSNSIKPDISLPTFTGEERGSIDVLGKVTLRVISSPDFQGNLKLSVCLVADAPTPPEPGNCCPGPTVVKTVKLATEGKTLVWTPTPGSSFVLLGVMAAVGGAASLPASGPLTIELLDNANPFLSFHPELPSAPATATTGFEWQSPWIEFSGDGFHSVSANQPLVATVSPPLATGDVWVTIAGREV